MPNLSTGADNRIRTDDLFLTKEVLCLLSYISNYISHEILFYHISFNMSSVFLNFCKKMQNVLFNPYLNFTSPAPKLKLILKHI